MQFSVMLSPQEYDLIAHAAAMVRSPISRWIREVAVRAASTIAPVREDRRPSYPPIDLNPGKLVPPAHLQEDEEPSPDDDGEYWPNPDD
jgi:hypothetical protein